MTDIPEEFLSKMFYCEKFNCKISPDVCDTRKELGRKYEKGMTKNQKYGINALIVEIVKNCIPCKIGEKNINGYSG